MQERRREQRFDLKLPCLVTVLESGLKKDLLQIETRNISCSGAYLCTPSPLFAGTRITIEVLVRLDTSETCAHPGSCINLNGQVLRSDAEGLAVKFDGRYQISSIERLIASNDTKARWLEMVEKSASDRIRPARRKIRPPILPVRGFCLKKKNSLLQNI